MDSLIKHVDLLIDKHEMYINNMLSIKMDGATITVRTQHADRIDDHREMIKDLKRIRTQLQYSPIS